MDYNTTTVVVELMKVEPPADHEIEETPPPPQQQPPPESRNDSLVFIDCVCLICGVAAVVEDLEHGGSSGGGGTPAGAPIFQSLMELIGVKKKNKKSLKNKIVFDPPGDAHEQVHFCKDCGDQVRHLMGLRQTLKQLERELKAGVQDINEKLAKSESRFNTTGQCQQSVLQRDSSRRTPVSPPGPLVRRSTRSTKGMKSTRFLNMTGRSIDDDDDDDENEESSPVLSTAACSAKVSPDSGGPTVPAEERSLWDAHHLVAEETNIKLEENVDDDVDIEDDQYVPYQEDPRDMDDDANNDDDGGDSDYLPPSEPEVDDADANLSSEPSNDSDSNSIKAGGVPSEDESSSWTPPPPPPPTQSSSSKKPAPLLAPSSSSKSERRGRPPKNQKRQETTSASVTYVATTSGKLKSSARLILPSHKSGATSASAFQKIRVHPVSGVHTYLNTSFEKIGESQWKCLTCEEVVTSLPRIKKHTLRSHTDKFVCNYCGQHKTSRTELRYHVTQVHEGAYRKPSRASHSCPICGKPYITKTAMEFHRVTHLSQEDIAEAEARGEKIVRYKDVYGRHQCTTCGETFCNVTVLKKHAIKMHSKTEEEKAEILRMCPHCGKSLSEQYFSRHVERYHSGLDMTVLKPFQCSECDKRFYTADRLLSHKRVHSGERPFQCELCSKTFPSHPNLKRHVMRIHTNERAHGCHLCPAAFVTRDHLTRHIAGVHEKKSQAEFYKEKASASSSSSGRK